MKQNAFLKRIKKKPTPKLTPKMTPKVTPDWGHSKINSRLHSMFYNMPAITTLEIPYCEYTQLCENAFVSAILHWRRIYRDAKYKAAMLVLK